MAKITKGDIAQQRIYIWRFIRRQNDNNYSHLRPSTIQHGFSSIAASGNTIAIS